MNTTPTTWTQLDQSNRRHYGRGKPAELLKAEAAAAAAWETYQAYDPEKSPLPRYEALAEHQLLFMDALDSQKEAEDLYTAWDQQKGERLAGMA